jgi:hypothetical protein
MKDPTPAQFTAVADWLAQCEKCGNVHAWTPNFPGSTGGTWAADGHSYAPRNWDLRGTQVIGLLRSAALRGAV